MNLNPVFTKAEHHFCSVPVPDIDAHKSDPSVEFTAEQIAGYHQSQTHPSLYYNESGWNGHKFWLATTPYPNGIGVFENPCIYYADYEDGLPPRVFTGINGNPIVKVDSNTDINSDPDLVADGNTLYLISRDNVDGYAVFAQKSTDGTTWTSRGGDPIWKPSVLSLPEMISPAIIKENSEFISYCFSGTTGSTAFNLENATGISWGLYRLDGASLETANGFSVDGKCYMGGNKFVEPWHGDLFKANDRYYMVLCGRDRRAINRNMNVYLAESIDGDTFFVYSRPLLASYQYYRPTAVVNEDNLFIMYFSTTGATVAESDLPNGASDVSSDGRYIGVVYKNFDDMLFELTKNVYSNVEE